MDDGTKRAIEQARRLLEDAALFHLKSIPLPVSIATQLVQLAEQGLMDNGPLKDGGDVE